MKTTQITKAIAKRANNLLEYFATHPLLTFSNAKTSKGEKLNILTAILYLAPAAMNCLSINLCKGSTKGCRLACLFTAGRGKFSPVQQARLRKADHYVLNPVNYMECIVRDIELAIKKAAKKHYKLAVRLNGTSDIDYSLIPVQRAGKTYANIFEAFSEVQFYDYTKLSHRLTDNTAKNYHLTFSFNGNNWSTCEELLRAGYNIAAVFYAELPIKYKGFTVINGDLTDIRFNDPTGVIVGLTAKGDAKKLEDSFIIQY